MMIKIFKKLSTGIAGATFTALSLLWGQSAFGEVQYNISMTMTPPEPGANAGFNASDASSSGSGTFYNTYSGIGRYVLGASGLTGRYAGYENTTRYGVDMGSFHVFQSFLTSSSLTVVNSNTACPGGSNTYGFMNIRLRSPSALRNPQDASSAAFKAGGTFTYDQSASPDITGVTTFDLAGPTLNNSPGFTANGVSGATCSSGKYNVAVSGTSPWDSYGTLFFGAVGGMFVGLHGSPVVSIISPITDLTVGRMAQLSGRAMSGLYQDFTSPTVSSFPVYLFPDGAGTTFTLRQITDYDDPNQYSTFGTIVCTSRNSPTQGFCSGTLTRQGVGGSGKIVCQVTTRDSSDVLACVGQKPGTNTAGITILARNQGKSLVAVTLPSPTFTLASATTSQVSATVRNMTGNPVVTMGIPSNVPDRLTAPFSLPNAFTGTGGTCTDTLNAYATCNLTLEFAPSLPGSYSQVLRVEYDNQIATVNATANVIGTVALDTLTVSPSGSFYVGGTQQFTATATYVGGSPGPQDVSSLVAWSTSDPTKATVSSTGLVTWIAPGSVDIIATSAVISDSQAVTVSAAAPPAVDFAIAAPAANAVIATGEQYTVRFSGGADPDSNADVYFYKRTSNVGCDSGGIGSWGSALNGSAVKENTDTGFSWDTTGVAAGTYYICGTISDGTTTRYAVSSNTIQVRSEVVSKMITVHPTSSSEKSYNVFIDLYENVHSTGGTLDNATAYASNTGTKWGESRAVAASPGGTVGFGAAYKSCINRNRGADLNMTGNWRLPTPQEFSYVATGTPNYNGPCNTFGSVISAAVPFNSGSCVSNHGIYDLVGSQMEWLDLVTTSTSGTLGSTTIQAATNESGAWVGKTAANYNGVTVPTTSNTVTRYDTQLGIPVSAGGDITSGFLAGDYYFVGASGSSYALVSSYYSSGSALGGRYYYRLDRAAFNVTNAGIGFRCAKTATTIPAIRITSPVAASNGLAADGSNNLTIGFQGYDSDDNADISLYYRAAGTSTGCSGDPASNGWTLIDNALKENTDTSKVWNIAALSNGFYHVCAMITDHKNSPQYHLSDGVFKRGSVTANPTIALVEPTGNNDTIYENQSFNITYNALDYDSLANVNLYYKTADSTGCSGTVTSNGWTALTTSPASLTESDTTASTDFTPINSVTYPANFYVCGTANDGSTTGYSNSGSSYIRVLPVSRCANNTGNYSTANGGCLLSTNSKVYSIDSVTYTTATATWTAAPAYCTNLNTAFVGGYNDWRMATVAELQAVQTGVANLLVNTSGNLNVWSSENVNVNRAYAVNVSTGVSTSTLKTTAMNNMCVRP